MFHCNVDSVCVPLQCKQDLCSIAMKTELVFHCNVDRACVPYRSCFGRYVLNHLQTKVKNWQGTEFYCRCIERVLFWPKIVYERITG